MDVGIEGRAARDRGENIQMQFLIAKSVFSITLHLFLSLLFLLVTMETCNKRPFRYTRGTVWETKDNMFLSAPCSAFFLYMSLTTGLLGGIHSLADKWPHHQNPLWAHHLGAIWMYGTLSVWIERGVLLLGCETPDALPLKHPKGQVARIQGCLRCRDTQTTFSSPETGWSKQEAIMLQ